VDFPDADLDKVVNAFFKDEYGESQWRAGAFLTEPRPACVYARSSVPSSVESKA
jgi:hypothetical protein